MLIDQQPILKERCQLMFENFNYKPASHRVHRNLKTWFLYSKEKGKAKRCVVQERTNVK